MSQLLRQTVPRIGTSYRLNKWRPKLARARGITYSRPSEQNTGGLGQVSQISPFSTCLCAGVTLTTLFTGTITAHRTDILHRIYYYKLLFSLNRKKDGTYHLSPAERRQLPRNYRQCTREQGPLNCIEHFHTLIIILYTVLV